MRCCAYQYCPTDLKWVFGSNWERHSRASDNVWMLSSCHWGSNVNKNAWRCGTRTFHFIVLYTNTNPFSWKYLLMLPNLEIPTIKIF